MSLPDKKVLPVVFGCQGTALTSAERLLFKEANPFGFILFKRNCENHEQVRWLIKEFQQTVGRESVAVLIDQEGGRVSRLQPPHWIVHPPARVFGAMYERDASWGERAMQFYARVVAHELSQLGILINCAPVLDLWIDGADKAIGDRALSRKPAVVAALARVWSETLLKNGVLPVVKHFPGHGRIQKDPHLDLPTVHASRAELESEDFVPFELLKDLPIGMNSHAIFPALDSDLPASLSATIHQNVIRGAMGFDGLLLSDDICMKALIGSPATLAQKTLDAGADITLHCNGKIAEMQEIAASLSPMSSESWARWEYAQSMVTMPDKHYSPMQDLATLDVLLGGFAYDEKSIT